MNRRYPASGVQRPVLNPSRAKHDSTSNAQALRPVPLGQRPVSVSHSRDTSKLPTGAIENMHFIFSKSVESRLASSTGGGEEPILSLPFKLHLLLKVC